MPFPGVPLAYRWGRGRMRLSALATWRPGPVGTAATPGPTARGRCDLKAPAPSGLGRCRGRGAKVGALTSRASSEVPRRHGGGIQALEQGGLQPPVPRTTRAGGGGGHRDPEAPGAGRRGGRERGERGAPGGPERAACAVGRAPRALRAAGGARAGREAQEEVPAEAEEVRQECGEGHHQRVPLPGRRPAGLRHSVLRPIRSDNQRGVICPLGAAAPDADTSRMMGAAQIQKHLRLEATEYLEEKNVFLC